MQKKYKIAVLPGDGIGPEIMEQGYKILEILNRKYFLNIEIQEYDIGGVAIDRHGTALPQKTLDGCEKSDAILFGSVGGGKWNNLPSELQPERAALLPLRKQFNLFANLRPVKLYSKLSDLSPLRKEISKKGFNIMCVRELTGGIYFGKPKGIKIKDSKEYAFDTEVYCTSEIERIAHFAFRLAKNRLCKVTSIDKANVLESSILWRKVVKRVSLQYPDVILSHLYVDNAAMQIIKEPSQFDVILCSNLFGDILSDECAIIAGSMGMLPSASLNENSFGLYEPAGGSAPDIAGQKIANPIAQILSIAMLIRYTMKMEPIANSIEYAVAQALEKGYRTFDIITNHHKKYIGTSEMGSIIADIFSKRS